MKLKRAHRTEAGETIVALIDVVFFLLVFFMLVGRMDATAPFVVTPPRGLTGEDMPGGGATLAISPEGALALDGAPMDRAEVIAALSAQVAADPALRLRLQADRDAPLRDVLPLLADLEATGLADVMLVVTPEGG